MKNTRILVLAVALIMLTSLSACSNSSASPQSETPEPEVSEPSSPPSGQICLYGEGHGIEKILDKEFELWYEYYNDEGMRHLFIEYPYYTAEFLNIWMRSDGNGILEKIYRDLEGTQSYNRYIMEFFKKIKSECPDTIFHGTDVGHQYITTGKRFLEYLEENDMEGSEQYLLAQEAIEQGKNYYGHSDHVYRENMMAENFIREFDKLNGESVMGIYGSAHTGLDEMDYNTRSVPCMANQLKERYGDSVRSEDLSWLAVDPQRVDIIAVNGKEFEASYFGKQDLAEFSEEYAYREFWRLENAYDEFKDRPKTSTVLPYHNYPMPIATGQVFVIDYIKTDGSVERMYYRSDEGYVWEGTPSTEEFTAE